jgi:hypothetical protein
VSAAVETQTDGSTHWIAATQTGDKFIWGTGVLDANGVAGTSVSRTAVTLSVPTGIVVDALFRGELAVGASIFLVFTSLQEADAAATDGFSDLICTSTTKQSGSFARLTNTSAQIGHRTSVAGGAGIYINTYGWIDTRGK